MSASLALQGAVVAALKADAGLTALISSRIYDAPPQDAVFPYVEIGEIQLVDDGAECFDGAAEAYVTLHVWSRSVGRPECHRIAEEIRGCLHYAGLDLGAEYDLIEITYRDLRVFRDADGVTSHGVVTLHALIDEI